MKVETIIHAIYEKYNERVEQEMKNLNGQINEGAMLDYFRNEFEPYIYQYLTWHYGPKLDTFWQTHEFPKKSKYAWVLVERRSHPNFWFVLRNIAWAAPDFSLYIFCSDGNYEFIKTILGDKINNVNIIVWFKGAASRQEGKDQYAQTFKMEKFYKLIEADYMIRIEMDTYMRKKIPESIFMDDYYGSPWAWMPDHPGGGGLIIRNIKSMIDLCMKEKCTNLEADDCWVGKKIIEYGYKFPDFKVRKEIFSENFPVADPIGVHQFWSFVQNFEINEPNKFFQHYVRYLTIDI